MSPDFMSTLQLPDIRQKAADGQDELSIRVYNGRLGFSVFSGTGKPPTWSEGLALENIRLFEAAVKLAIAGQPGSKSPLIFRKFDALSQPKKYVTTSQLIIGKDEKQMIYLEVQCTQNNAPKVMRFILKSSGGVTTGENYNDVAGSANKANAILYYLDKYVPMLITLTNKKQDRDANGGNRGGGNFQKGGGGGGNFNRGNGGGQPAPQQHSAPAATDFGDSSF